MKSNESPYTTRLDQGAEEKYVPTATARISAATDECDREMHVRLRVYPGWVASGKLSRTDAEDRGERLETAIVLLRWLDQNLADLAADKLTAQQFVENARLLHEQGK